jgi:hypothetical protein
MLARDCDTQRALVPIRTGRGLNSREYFYARAKRVKKEREAVRWLLNGLQKPALPCVVVLTRHSPSNGLDSDNLQGALKAIRDEVADWLGVDDKNTELVRYGYEQKRAEWGVLIEFRTYRYAN